MTADRLETAAARYYALARAHYARHEWEMGDHFMDIRARFAALATRMRTEAGEYAFADDTDMPF